MWIYSASRVKFVNLDLWRDCGTSGFYKATLFDRRWLYVTRAIEDPCLIWVLNEGAGFMVPSNVSETGPIRSKFMRNWIILGTRTEVEPGLWRVVKLRTQQNEKLWFKATGSSCKFWSLNDPVCAQIRYLMAKLTACIGASETVHGSSSLPSNCCFMKC